MGVDKKEDDPEPIVCCCPRLPRPVLLPNLAMADAEISAVPLIFEIEEELVV